MIRKLKTINGEGFECIVWYDDVANRGWFIADMDIDSDGGKNVDGDKYWQADTTLHHNGKPIDALVVPGMVVPGWLPKAVGPIIMGCQGRLTNLANMRSVETVTHDSGPLFKTGEATPEAARRLGVNPNSVSGGEERSIILYEFWPGTAARVDGELYNLQPA